MPIPKMVFNGTAIATSSSERTSACTALGALAAAQTAPRPCSKVR